MVLKEKSEKHSEANNTRSQGWHSTQGASFRWSANVKPTAEEADEKRVEMGGQVRGAGSEQQMWGPLRLPQRHLRMGPQLCRIRRAFIRQQEPPSGPGRPYVGVFFCSSHHGKTPRDGWFEQRKCIFSVLKAGFRDQGVGGFGVSWDPCPWLMIALFSLYPHLVIPLCMYVS